MEAAVIITYRCNARCHMCNTWQFPTRQEDEISPRKTFRGRLALDDWYVRNWNLWLDFIILFKTIYVVAKREGAH